MEVMQVPSIFSLSRLLSDLHTHAHTGHIAHRTVRDRVQLIERQCIRFSALQRVALLSAQANPSGPSASHVGVGSKPFGYSQEIAYQHLITALRHNPHALAMLIVLNPEVTTLTNAQLESLALTICFDLFPPDQAASESENLLAFMQTAFVFSFGSACSMLHRRMSVAVAAPLLTSTAAPAWDESVNVSSVISRMMQIKSTSALLRAYLKREGQAYLELVLQDFVVDFLTYETIEFDMSNFESVDSSGSLSQPAQPPKALQALLRWCQRVIEQILGSSDHLPFSLRILASSMVRLAAQHESPDQPYSESILVLVMSELLCFPFLFEGLMQPERFGLTEHYAVLPSTRHNLETIVTILWKLVAGARFSSSQHCYQHLNKFFDQWRPRLVQFFARVVDDVPSVCSVGQPCSAVEKSQDSAASVVPICVQMSDMGILHQITAPFLVARQTEILAQPTSEQCECLASFDSTLSYLQSQNAYLQLDLPASFTSSLHSCPCGRPLVNACGLKHGMCWRVSTSSSACSVSALLRLSALQFSLQVADRIAKLGAVPPGSAKWPDIYMTMPVPQLAWMDDASLSVDCSTEDIGEYLSHCDQHQRENVDLSELQHCLSLFAKAVREFVPDATIEYNHSMTEASSLAQLLVEPTSVSMKYHTIGSSSVDAITLSDLLQLEAHHRTFAGFTFGAQSQAVRQHAPSEERHKHANASNAAHPAVEVNRASDADDVFFGGALICFELSLALRRLPKAWLDNDFRAFVLLAGSLWEKKRAAFAVCDNLKSCMHLQHRLSAISSSLSRRIANAVVQQTLRDQRERARYFIGPLTAALKADLEFIGNRELEQWLKQGAAELRAKEAVSAQFRLGRSIFASEEEERELARHEREAKQRQEQLEMELRRQSRSCLGDAVPDQDEFMCARCTQRLYRGRRTAFSFLQTHDFGLGCTEASVAAGNKIGEFSVAPSPKNVSGAADGGSAARSSEAALPLSAPLDTVAAVSDAALLPLANDLMVICVREDDAFRVQLMTLASVCPTLPEFHRLIWVGPERYHASLLAESSDHVSKQLRVPPPPCVEEFILETASQQLKSALQMRSVRRAVGALLQVRSLLLAALTHTRQHSAASAETYQTVLCYILCRANPEAFLSRLCFVRAFVPGAAALKCISDFCVAARCLQRLAPPALAESAEFITPNPALSTSESGDDMSALIQQRLHDMGFADEDCVLAHRLCEHEASSGNVSTLLWRSFDLITHVRALSSPTNGSSGSESKSVETLDRELIVQTLLSVDLNVEEARLRLQAAAAAAAVTRRARQEANDGAGLGMLLL